jgi:hypothetical protein
MTDSVSSAGETKASLPTRGLLLLTLLSVSYGRLRLRLTARSTPKRRWSRRC